MEKSTKEGNSPAFKSADVIRIVVKNKSMSLIVNQDGDSQEGSLKVNFPTWEDDVHLHPYVSFNNESGNEIVTYLGYHCSYLNPTKEEELRVFFKGIESIGEDAQ